MSTESTASVKMVVKQPTVGRIGGSFGATHFMSIKSGGSAAYREIDWIVAIGLSYDLIFSACAIRISSIPEFVSE